MARTAATSTALRRSSRNLKREANDIKEEEVSPKRVKQEASPPLTPPRKRARKASVSPPVDTKTPDTKAPKTPKKPTDKASALQAKKLAAYPSSPKSPFPAFAAPTPQDCRLAHKILASLHGDRVQPEQIKAAPKDTAGCGNSPSVLDALVRTVLSQNTSDRNSSAAKRSMDDVYGGSDQWEAILSGGQPKLQNAIKTGGLSVVKSKVIIDVLHQVRERHGAYSLDHLFSEPDNNACMRELLSFKGIGPKTASCVLLFCLRRQSFAVDTHVHRLAGLLGWRPANASREEAHSHLDARIPGEEKYPLHVLLIRHGKTCAECRAGGKNLGKCELRNAFKKVKGKTEENDVKEEDIDIKDEVEEAKEEVKAIKEEDE